MHYFDKFTLKDMVEMRSILREMGNNAGSMEEVANRIVRYLYGSLVDSKTGKPACALIRLFKTHAWGGLDRDLQEFAVRMGPGHSIVSNTKCLTLLATAGEKPQWNDRRTSAQHQAIPLVSEKFVEGAPMVATMMHQFGLEMSTVLRPDPAILLDLAQTTFNVFFVPHAEGNPIIPTQDEFVMPCGVRSVLGFGGLLISGDLFVVIMFLKVEISREVAELFKLLAVSVKIAMLPFVDRVFVPSEK